MAPIYLPLALLFAVCPAVLCAVPAARSKRGDWYEYDYIFEDTDCSDLEYLCKQHADAPSCSNHGPCFCGECLCNPITMERPGIRYSGHFCECDDYSCPFSDNQPCGGSDHGECSCGRCECLPGWTGPDCSCDETDEECNRRLLRSHNRSGK